MKELKQLFEEEDKIQQQIRLISKGIIELSEYVNSKSAIDLSQSQVTGKRIRNSCDSVNEAIHGARKKLGMLMVDHLRVVLNDKEQLLNKMENELSLMHGSIESIGMIAEHFYEAKNRELAFENLSAHYADLVQQCISLLGEKALLRRIA